VDRAAWFTFADAQEKILKGQLPLIIELADLLRVR
jgi:predicted NUDIX family NTP pyrophosphohydrolase